MEYQVLDQSRQAVLIRNHLMQVEADHMQMTMNQEVAQARLDALPKKASKDEKEQLAADIARFDSELARLEDAHKALNEKWHALPKKVRDEAVV